MMRLRVTIDRSKNRQATAKDLYRKVLGEFSAHDFRIRGDSFVFAEVTCPLVKSIELVKHRFFGFAAPVLVQMIFCDAIEPEVTLIFSSENDEAANRWADVLHGTLIGPMANLLVS